MNTMLLIFAGRIMAIVLAVFFAGVAYSAEKPNIETAEPKDATKAEQRGSDDKPITVKILPSPDAETKTAQEEKYRNEKSIQDEKIADATIWLARITAALAIFTGLLWWATIRLAQDAKQTADRQAEEMKESLRIAKQAANAAERTSDVAHKSLSVAQRAFVFGKGFAVAPNGTEQEIRDYLFWVVWENVGITPATNIENWIRAKIVPTGEQDTSFPMVPRTNADTALGPRAIFQTTRLAIPFSTIMDCWNGTVKIFIWARVEYRDLFNPEIVHYHEQCARIALLRNPSTTPLGETAQYLDFRIFGPQNGAG